MTERPAAANSPLFADLYQEVVLEHYKKPRNFKVVEDATHYALGKNPLCGDQFAVYLKMDDAGKIQDIGFQGDGCAISKASASMMTAAVKGKTREEADALRSAFHRLLTMSCAGGSCELELEECRQCVGRLKFFETVREYPVRVKCATLARHALEAALDNRQAPVTTENA